MCEKRICRICHKEYIYPCDDGADLECCTPQCEDQFINEEYEWWYRQQIDERLALNPSDEEIPF